jgi:hypothetical protein
MMGHVDAVMSPHVDVCAPHVDVSSTTAAEAQQLKHHSSCPLKCPQQGFTQGTYWRALYGLLQYCLEGSLVLQQLLQLSSSVSGSIIMAASSWQHQEKPQERPASSAISKKHLVHKSEPKVGQQQKYHSKLHQVERTPPSALDWGVVETDAALIRRHSCSTQAALNLQTFTDFQATMHDCKAIRKQSSVHLLKSGMFDVVAGPAGIGCPVRRVGEALAERDPSALSPPAAPGDPVCHSSITCR